MPSALSNGRVAPAATAAATGGYPRSGSASRNTQRIRVDSTQALTTSRSFRGTTDRFAYWAQRLRCSTTVAAVVEPQGPFS